MLFYNVTLSLPHQVVKSISPPLESGRACDSFHQWNTAEVMLSELQGCIIKGKTAFTLFAGTHTYGPLCLRPVKSLPTQKLSCYQETK